MVGIMPERDALAEAEAAVADGLTALQIKGGEDPDRDVRLVTDLPIPTLQASFCGIFLHIEIPTFFRRIVGTPS